MRGTAVDAGLVDELRLIVYPLIVGEGKALFSSSSAAPDVNCTRSSSCRTAQR